MNAAAGREFNSQTASSLAILFEQLAAAQPMAPAVVGTTWQPTYHELNAAANRLAHAIISRGGARGEPVALLMDHDAPQLAALVGAVKAGGIGVVLNPTDPPERLKQILEDTGPCAVLTDAANHDLAGRMAGSTRGMIRVEDHGEGLAENPGLTIAPEDAAAILFTSGSTGRAKGVVQTHRTLLDNARRYQSSLGLQTDDRILLPASLSGGMGLAITWAALMTGAALAPFPAMKRGVAGLADWMNAQALTAYMSTSSLFRHFMLALDADVRFPRVRMVRLGSEPATAEDFAAFQRHFGAHCVFHHTCASVEAGTLTHLPLQHDARVDAGKLPIGRPVEGVEILLLDEDGHEVSPGEPGEICVRGRWMSPGYWRDEALTATRFKSEGNDGVRVFHSGDLARRTPEGLLVYAGRKDDRVKIRGHRIELFEIEEVLRRQPEVAGAAVCAQVDSQADARLAAFVVWRVGHAGTAETLRAALREVLPPALVPSGFVFLDALPLTPHGKIDRARLRQIQPPATDAPIPNSALSTTETLLAGFWSEVLRREVSGREADFFDLGGDSLNAAVVAARVYAALGVELHLRAFTEHPRLVDLARAVDQLRAESQAPGRPRLERVPRTGPLPASFTQERIWKYSRTQRSAAGYTVATRLRLHGPLDARALREAMTGVAGRHEMLRTTFVETNGALTQIVHAAEPVPLPLVDFTSDPDPQKAALIFFQSEAAKPFELATGPLARFTLVRLGENEHWLFSITHHIILDAWSWTIYFRDLKFLYETALRGGTAPPADPAALQYADFAAWQRDVWNRDGPAWQAEIEWWGSKHANGPDSPTLPFRRFLKRRNTPATEGLILFGLDPAVSSRLEQLRRRESTTFYVLRLAAFAALLAEETRSADLVIGAYVTNRDRFETQNMFGDFANLATLRLHCELDWTFHEWIGRVQKGVGELQAHASIPYEDLCAELRRRKVPVPEIRAIFSVASHTAPVRLGELEMTWLARRRRTMPWGFTLTFSLHKEDRDCFTDFDARIYRPARVRAFIERLKHLLDAVGQEPDLSLAALLAKSSESRAGRY